MSHAPASGPAISDTAAGSDRKGKRSDQAVADSAVSQRLSLIRVRLAQAIPVSAIARELSLSRQFLYKLICDHGLALPPKPPVQPKEKSRLSPEERRRLQAERQAARWQDPALAQKMRQTFASEEHRTRLRALAEARWRDDAYRRKQAAKSPFQGGQSQSARLRALWADPEYRARTCAALQDPAYRQRQREAGQRLWKDPTFREKQQARNGFFCRDHDSQSARARAGWETRRRRAQGTEDADGGDPGQGG